ncbi:MAG TPA: hypothetical protein VGN86_00555 [Pyrinomonadaceae bacterium]|nr:hypothetical protein [Pyrinomonadaceae bacterium]
MKIKAIVSAVALCLVAATVSFAATNPHMGTWKLNEAKSKFAKGATKNTKVVYEAAGSDVKVTVDGIDATGAATHNEWTGKFDGKDYAVSGDPTSDMRSYKVLTLHSMRLTARKAGKITLTGRITVSNNGKMRTVITTGKNAAGKQVTNVAVYDKE